jgi:hypothetical protein
MHVNSFDIICFAGLAVKDLKAINSIFRLKELTHHEKELDF